MSNGCSDISSGVGNSKDAADAVMGGDCREKGEGWNGMTHTVLDNNTTYKLSIAVLW